MIEYFFFVFVDLYMGGDDPLAASSSEILIEHFETAYTYDPIDISNYPEMILQMNRHSGAMIAAEGYNQVFTQRFTTSEDGYARVLFGADSDADTNDVSSFTFDTAGFYLIEAKGRDSGGGTLPDPNIAVRAKIGNGNWFGLGVPLGVDDAVGYDSDFGEGEDEKIVLFIPNGGATIRIDAFQNYLAEPDGQTVTVSISQVTLLGEDAPSRLITDDCPDTTSTSCTISAGSSQTGSIEKHLDMDWHKVNMQKGHVYKIEIEGFDSGDGFGSLVAPTILPADVRQNIDVKHQSERTLIVAARSAGAYFFNALATLPPPRTGGYRINVTSLGRDIPDNDTTVATTLPGQLFSGKFEYSNDVDWIKVWLLEGMTYEISAAAAGDEHANVSIHGTTTGQPQQQSLGFGISNGYHLEQDDGVVVRQEGNGQYYITVSHVGEPHDNFPVDYDLRVSPDVFGSSLTSCFKMVNLDTDWSGVIEIAEDSDWFCSINFDPGAEYAFAVYADEPGAPGLSIFGLDGIYDSAGKEVLDLTQIDNEAPGITTYFGWSPPSSGRYAISVEGSLSHDVGPYTLRINEDDYSQNINTNALLSLNAGTRSASLTGEIKWDGDHDWIAVDLVAGRDYVISMAGESSGGGTLGDPYITAVHGIGGGRLLGNNGFPLEGTFYDDDDSQGNDAQISIRPSISGRYYIEVTNANGIWAGSPEIGTYTITVSY